SADPLRGPIENPALHKNPTWFWRFACGDGRIAEFPALVFEPESEFGRHMESWLDDAFRITNCCCFGFRIQFQVSSVDLLGASREMDLIAGAHFSRIDVVDNPVGPEPHVFIGEVAATRTANDHGISINRFYRTGDLCL